MTNDSRDLAVNGYRIVSTLHEGRTTVVYRATRSTNGEPVILKLLKSGGTRKREVLRFKQEVELIAALSSSDSGAVVELEEREGGLMMVMPDIGGNLLERSPLPLPIQEFLSLAVALSNATAFIHNRRIRLRNVNPSGVIWNPETKRVALIDFAMADEMSERSVSPQAPPSALEGRLEYISPEQTGRMNRVVDYRSDFYSLGVTFYRLLGARLPWIAEDTLGVIHLHMAGTPTPLSDLNPAVPEMVSRIVLKLMAKMADDRYQSATGLQADLSRCLKEYAETGEIPLFELGTKDFTDRLRVSQRLYGRERETEQLLRAFEHVRAGGSKLLFIAGNAGVGKTALVREARRPIAERGGYFIEGKFDQLQRSTPYSAWIQAFTELTNRLLVETDEEVTRWREAIRAALDGGGRVLTDVIPNLELIIGPQPDVPTLGAAEAQNRFDYVFSKFVGAIATRAHPLVLFLDDLQWIDDASLKLLRTLLSGAEIAHLLTIGAYRQSEVEAAHPLAEAIAALRNTGTSIDLLTLEEISEQTVSDLIADTLEQERSAIGPLGHLIYSKTGGNPLFLLQTLKALTEKRVISFDERARSWQWNLDRVAAVDMSDDVATVILARLRQLPQETQRTLSSAACIGYRFDPKTLSIVLEQSEELTAKWLEVAQRAGLIVSMANDYQFVHDRVQQAAYHLIPDEARVAHHLRIGRLLRANTAEDELPEKLFEIVFQLNRGTGLITSSEEREVVAALNLMAGKRAKASMAYALALDYLNAGISLLGPDPWERQHGLTYSLEINRAECEYLIGRREVAERRLEALLEHARGAVERAAVAGLQIDLYTTLDESRRAVAAGLDFLRCQGIDCPPHPSADDVRREYDQIGAMLDGRAMEELLGLPLMSDSASLATVDVLIKAWPPALFTDANLASLMICKAVAKSLELGNCDASCFAYAVLGRIAGARFGDYQAGFRLGRLGYELLERRGLKRFEARTSLCFANSIVPWMQHVRACEELERGAFDAALRTGDVMYAAFACNSLNTELLFAGKPLQQMEDEAEQRLSWVAKTRFGMVIDSIAAQVALIRTLRGATTEFGRFDDAHVSEVDLEARLSLNPALAIAECRYWIRKLQARYMAGDVVAALDAASKAKTLLWTAPLAFEEVDYHFYSALVRAAHCDRDPAGKRAEHWRALVDHGKQLEVWSQNCRENFENRAALIGAEIARLEDRPLEAERLYERAIASARENGFVHNEALAYEVAAAFYARRGFEMFARTYLMEATSRYARWGAEGKVRQLERQHPWLTSARVRPPAVPIEPLDAASLAKAQQAIAREIEMDRLLGQVMRIVIENAGAQRGYLLRKSDDAWAIIAEGEVGRAEVRVPSPVSIEESGVVPQAVVRFVSRTTETVILDDAATSGAFVNEPRIQERSVKSLLCAPVLSRGNLLAIVYLENGLTTHAFTPERVRLLETLLSQAAISFENAKIYEALRASQEEIRGFNLELERRVADRTAQLEAANKELESFAYSVSHDLRAPLRHIDGFLELLQKSLGMELGAQSRHYMAVISDSSKKMGALINDLLSFSRTARSTLSRQPFDLGALVRDVVAEIGPDAGGRLVRWTVEELPVIHGDRSMLRLVLVNLLANALKFTRPRDIAEIQVGRLPRGEEEWTVDTFFVRDNGVGFDMSYADRLFGVFQRLHRAEEFEGTGIGLANVRRIIGRHGGRTWAEGEVDRGATIYFTLPRAEQDKGRRDHG